MKVFYNDDYVASPQEFATTRKSAKVAEALRSEPFVRLVDPNQITSLDVLEGLVLSIHAREYIQALKTGMPESLAVSSSLAWGPSTYRFALAHSHGVFASVVSVLSGEKRAGTLSSGLHHARPDTGLGFCTLNGIAAGVAHALAMGHKVVILDFDAHFGGGTFAHLERLNQGAGPRAVQIDVSVSRFDDYAPHGPHYRAFVACGDTPDKPYLDAIQRALSHGDSLSMQDALIIYNAGVDPVNGAYFDDPFGTMLRRDQMVAEWVGQRPAIFTLAGGYTTGFSLDDIVNMHVGTVRAWANVG